MMFDPPMLDMGPVLPYTPQGDSREVTVTNEGTFDVEIFSLDFDKVGSCAHAVKKTNDGVCPLPPRNMATNKITQSIMPGEENSVRSEHASYSPMHPVGNNNTQRKQAPPIQACQA